MIDVIIIGGGASGIVSAIFAKRDNNKVVVLERNSKCLKKLLMTGNGKCNYFNEVYGLNNYHSEDMDVVDKIISDNNINSAKEFFDSIGIIPKIKNGYYYPFSNQASTIRNALLLEAEDRGVEIIYDSLVTDIKKENNSFIISCNNTKYTCNNLVLASGSYACSKTGSDGVGYSFLEKFGHTIIEPLPALVQLVSNGNYLKEWDGVRSDVRVELFEDDKYIDYQEGEIQLTNYGVSGICIFNLSHYVTRGLNNKKKEVIKINFVPFIETLISPWMDNYSRNNPNKKLGELLEGFLNYKLVNVILKVSNLSRDIYYKDLSNEEKLRLCKNLRSFPVEIVSTKSFDSCQVCNGGVKLSEINPNTFESNIISNLFITGELLDINGNCGGYNLTVCWISGMLAGKYIGGLYD